VPARAAGERSVVSVQLGADDRALLGSLVDLKAESCGERTGLQRQDGVRPQLRCEDAGDHRLRQPGLDERLGAFEILSLA